MKVVSVFAFGILLATVNCQSLGSAQSASLSGQFTDLKNAFDSGISNGLSAVSSQAKDLASAAQSAISGATSQLTAAKDNLLTAANNQLNVVKSMISSTMAPMTIQATGIKDALNVVANKTGTTVTKIGNGPKDFSKAFWSDDVSNKFHQAAAKVKDFKLDSKYDAPKSELANYMMNSQSQPNISDMINLAQKHLKTPEEAAKFFEQMASIADQQKL